MKVAVATDDNSGFEAFISEHFGRCPFYMLVDVDKGEIREVTAVESPFYGSHGEPGEVPAFIKKIGAQVIIAGGMGPKAIRFFEQYGIQVVTGVRGTVREVVRMYLEGKAEGASPCLDHEHDDDTHETPLGEASELREEIVSLKRQLDLATERLENLEKEKK
ncbi:MAG: NifB/NifX family molybdenum-iron cluster-binding protein [Thermodesulfobacteriota bacterium]